jgi:hypothetical protein
MQQVDAQIIYRAGMCMYTCLELGLVKYAYVSRFRSGYA